MYMMKYMYMYIAKWNPLLIDICTCACTVGGLESKSQEAALRRKPDIIVATPGRLVDHLHNTPSFSLQTIEILVLDEADRYTCIIN